MTTPPFDPQPCDSGAGTGGLTRDVENTILCDLDAQGNLLGTALGIYEYDINGVPVGAPTFVDPATGLPYVPTGTLQICPDAACLPPMQFCQTSTTTGPVEHPGRQYDITLPINPGFAVQSLQVDQVSNAAGITWEVDDPDGEQFRQNLTTFIEGRIPASATVTITNPNAGVQQVCGAALPMQIHIECLRLDQNPPNLIELMYNAGQDMVQNPAYNEFPALTPPVSQGNYGFHLLARQDDPGPFPGNPPSGRVLCTSVANSGWETNDVGRTFEIWGQDVVTGSNVTPTPRGTPVQEITSDGPPPGGLSTIWQTFVAPASGNFLIRVVHGARDPGEQHRITLDNGDTNATQNGDLIDDNTTPPSVTSNGGPNPWTVFNQTIPLNGGSTYTLALSTTNPVGGARGGLFTDMRAYIDRPDQRATATTDDATCIVTTDETSTNTLCSFWQPQCVGGTVAGWQRVDTGVTFTNAAFWAQVPSPECCTPEVQAAEGGSSLSNMIVSDVVCAIVGGIPSPAIRVVVTDPSGGVLQEQFIGPNGFPVAPDSWTAGPCSSNRQLNDAVLCDLGSFSPGPNGNGVVYTQFLRKYVQSLSDTGQGQINSVRDFALDGSGTYTPIGPVVDCASIQQPDREPACWTTTAGGSTVFTGTIRHDDKLPFPGWLLYDQNLTVVPSSEPGLTFVPCGATDPVTTTGLCLGNGTPIGIVVRRDSVTGVLTQDGWINLLTGAFTAGNPPAGTQACGDSTSITTSGILCDIDGGGNVVGLVIVQYEFNPDGSVASTTLLNAVTGAVYVPTGTVTTCPTGTEQPDADLVILCDNNGSFLRDYRRDETGTVVAVSNYTVAGAPYVPVGPVGTCAGRDQEIMVLCDSTPTRFLRRYNFNLSTGALVSITDTTLDGSTPFVPVGAVGVCPVDAAQQDIEQQILCDSTPTRFLRAYKYDAETGVVISVTNTTLDGTTAFAPVGAVGVCAQTVATDFDFTEEVLCDANGTAFIRRFTFNSVTGVVTATTNLTLAGAAFAPVGAVGVCSNCCPSVVGSGCTNTGSGFYTAIRATNGTISLIDSVSGAVVLAANIVACPSDNTVRTLTAQARQLTNATPWTPGADVVGTLTSLTVTGVSGLWDMVDQNGTALTGLPAGLTLTWSVTDDNTLSGPTSVTPQVGSSVVANWTVR